MFAFAKEIVVVRMGARYEDDLNLAWHAACTCHWRIQWKLFWCIEIFHICIRRIDSLSPSRFGTEINALRLCSSMAYIAYHGPDFNIKRQCRGSIIGLIARFSAAQVCFK